MEGRKEGRAEGRSVWLTILLHTPIWNHNHVRVSHRTATHVQDMLSCNRSIAPCPVPLLPLSRRLSSLHKPDLLATFIKMPLLRLLSVEARPLLLAAAKRRAGPTLLIASPSADRLARPQCCVRYLSHRSTALLATQPTSASSSAQASPPRASPQNDIPPTDLGVTPPVSQRTIRVVLAVVVASASVLFFRYIAAADTVRKPAARATPPAASPLPTPPTATSTSSSITPSIVEAIGNTPLIELQSLSRLTGRRILAKMENLNPAGSVKDRTALALIRVIDTERQRRWKEEGRVEVAGESYGTIIEATGGNTGVALAMLAPLFGYNCIFTYPDYIAPTKVNYMATLGATILPAPAVPFSSPQHFYNMARNLSQVTPNSYWSDQFENEANYSAHYHTTGPEIWRQTAGAVKAFVCAAGTGGTMAGVSAYLKQCNGGVKCMLIDPPNSGLYAYYTDGGWQGRETDVVGGVVEGIGIYRLTANMRHAVVDGVIAGLEREAVEMAWWLLKEEGLCVGASAALNVCGAVKAARTMDEGDMVVTILCDGGAAYSNRLYNPEWLNEQGLVHVMQKKVTKSLDWIS